LSERRAEGREERHPPGADGKRDPEREHDAREEGERDQEDEGRNILKPIGAALYRQRLTHVMLWKNGVEFSCILWGVALTE